MTKEEWLTKCSKKTFDEEQLKRNLEGMTPALRTLVRQLPFHAIVRLIKGPDDSEGIILGYADTGKKATLRVLFFDEKTDKVYPVDPDNVELVQEHDILTKEYIGGLLSE